ncbi:MAG: helix-turn-helix domain-containing protein [Cyanobacteria bacterium]|nr:helix-turn-helix domain-containing protein [Cyanobacteriota bacterium]
MDESALGVLLQWLRNQRGLSLRELAQLSDVDHAYIYRLETGDKESPSVEVISKLLRALKAGRRESDMVRYLADHAATDPELVRTAVADKAVTYEVFAMVAGAAHRGTRPDYSKLIARARMLLEDDDGLG